MRFFLSALAVVLSLTARAQYPVSPNLLDENGLRTGHWTLWYDSAWKEVKQVDSVIFYRLIRFEKGKPTGKVRDFYKNGSKQWEGFLISLNPDVMDGLQTQFHPNGNVAYRSTYVNGVQHGLAEQFSITGRLENKGMFVNGKMDGHWTYYYENGNINSEGVQKNGKWEGFVTSYYPSGKIKAKGFYKDNELAGKLERFEEAGWRSGEEEYKPGRIPHGVYREFFSDGSISVEYRNVDGKTQGPFVSRHAPGVLKQTGQYKDDLAVGEWKKYYPNGKLQSQGMKVADKLEGRWLYWDEKGRLTNDARYHDGMLTDFLLTYDSAGWLQTKALYEKDTATGPCQNYFPNGKVESEGNNKRGRKHGPWKSYHNNGVVASEGVYAFDKKDGEWKYYNDQASLIEVEHWSEGAMHGLWKTWYPNGQQHQEIEYVDGYPNGTLISYHENGQLQKSAPYKMGIQEGRAIFYRSDGSLEGEAVYRNDTVIFAKRNYTNGKLETESAFVKGKLDGINRFYYADGTVKQEGNNKNGLAVGPWVSYDSVTRRPNAKVNYSEGKLDGVWERLDAKGKVTERRHYRMGFLETRKNLQDSVLTLLRMDQIARAKSTLQWMMEVVKRDGATTEDKINIPYVQARVAYQAQEYETAIAYYKDWIRLLEKYKRTDTDDYEAAFHNIATAYRDMGKYDEAIRYFDQSLQYFRGDKISVSYWTTIDNKASAVFLAGRKEEATNLYMEEWARATKSFKESASQLWDLRYFIAEYFYFKLDDNAEARSRYSSLIADMEAAGDISNRRLYILYLRMANLDNTVEAISKFLTYCERNHQIIRKEYAEKLTVLYYHYSASRALDTTSNKSALAFAAKLKGVEPEVSDPVVHAKVCLAIGNNYYDQAAYAEALPFVQKALQILTQAKLGESISAVPVLQTLAFTIWYADKTRADESENYFLTSIQIRSRLMKKTSPDYYRSLIELGGFYNSVEKMSAAHKVLAEAREILNQVEDPASMARVDIHEGDSFFNEAKYEAALASYRRAFSFYEKDMSKYADRAAMASSYMASCSKNLDRYPEAKEYGERSIQIAKESTGEKSAFYYRRVNSLALIHNYFLSYDDAMKGFKTAARGMEELYGKFSPEYCMAASNIADVYYNMGEYRKAIAEAEAILPHLDSLRNADDYMGLLQTIARAAESLNDVPLAERYYKDEVGFTIAVFGQNNVTSALAMTRLGRFYRANYRYEEAENMLRQSLNIILQSDYGHTATASTYLLPLANTLADRDKHKEAETMFREAVALASLDTLNRPSLYIDAGEDLFSFYTKLGRYEESNKWVDRISAFTERHNGKTFLYARIRNEKVVNAVRLGLDDEARREAEQLLQLLEEITSSGNWLVLNLHNQLGQLALRNDDFAEANREFRLIVEALERNPKRNKIENINLATFYSNLSKSELCLGSISEAAMALHKADSIWTAAKADQTALTRINFMAKHATLLEAQGKGAEAEGLWKGVQKTLLQYTEQNFYFMSDEEKALFWKDNNGYFRNSYSIVMRRHNQHPALLGDMYNVQLATKGILLSSSNKIRKRLLSSRDTALVHQYYRWTQHREMLAQLYATPSTPGLKRKIDSLQVATAAIEKDMNITAEDMSRDRGGSITTWNNIQASLGPREAAVELVRFAYYDRYVRDSILYAALILTAETKDHPQVVVFGNGKAMEGRSFKYYRNAMLHQVQDSLSYDIFWKPLEKVLVGKSTVYLSADGVYNQVSLGSLRTAPNRYLLDDKNIILVSNTKDVLSIKARKPKRFSVSKATLVGFPTYFLGKQDVMKRSSDRGVEIDERDATGINPLLGTADEVNKVAGILSGHKLETVSLLGDGATEHAVKQVQHPRVLHIATHGFFVDNESSGTLADMMRGNDPLLRSGLLLTGAANYIQNNVRIEEENGILTAYEAANLNLDQTDLVVLSACETGRGQVQNGEGVYGLQRAFQTAGVQSIIMSLWKVDDQATQELMTAFYQGWMNGQSKEEALKAAQLQIKSRYPHPAYWGAFVMLEN